MFAEKKGYAKINLHLDITGILPNGYHSVNTVMQTLSLCDTVTVKLRGDREIRVECDNTAVPVGDGNIAARAAHAFAAATDKELGADIFIAKKIPMAAGLAGGSADAAATLKALNELHDNIFSTSELCRIGSMLGADVPFCIMEGTASACGIGDVLTPTYALPDCHIVVACGGEGVSTPFAYSLLDSIYAGFTDTDVYAPRATDALTDALHRKDLPAICRNTYNIFESPILNVRPVAASIKQTLCVCGALGAMMSGSGPSVFGIFDSAESAARAKSVFDGMNIAAFLCTPHNA